MDNGLATGIIIGSLLVGVWCCVAAVRNRWIDLSHLVGMVAVEVALLVQAVIAVVRIAGGARPEELGTFLGYLVVAVVIPPLAVVLSFMERTRWGSVIAAAAGFVIAIMVVRLQQVWTPLR